MPYREIREVTKNRSFVQMGDHASVREAVQAMADRHIGAVAVVSGSRLVGIFTERDLITRVIAAGREIAATTLAEVMTPDPETVVEHDTVRKALGLMKVRNVRHMPVVRDDVPVGMVSIRDFLGIELAEIDRQREMEGYLWEHLA